VKVVIIKGYSCKIFNQKLNRSNILGQNFISIGFSFWVQFQLDYIYFGMDEV
jgi:hypothetical protein